MHYSTLHLRSETISQLHKHIGHININSFHTKSVNMVVSPNFFVTVT